MGPITCISRKAFLEISGFSFGALCSQSLEEYYSRCFGGGRGREREGMLGRGGPCKLFHSFEKR